MSPIFKTELIDNYMIENKLSKNRFCKLCKISISTLNKIFAHDDNIGTIALFKIARTLSIRICELFVT